jgi:hypothetical protein
MRTTLLLLLAFFPGACLFAQFDPARALEKFGTEHPTEKIHLAYTAEDFFAGERIWFKAYVVTGAGPSDLSTNLYVELYNTQRELLNKCLVPLYQGAGEGSLLLPEDLPEGRYFIRAYTLWSLNFGREALYLHQFPVYNPQSPKRLQPKPVQWNAASFPESGTLVDGVPATVGLRLFSKTSLPASWTATVTAKPGGQVVATCRSLNREVGSFQFTPDADERYEVKITDNNGAGQVHQLAPVKRSGAVIGVTETADAIVASLTMKGGRPGASQLLIGQMHNQLVYRAIVRGSDTTVLARIPTASLETGILHLTLFDGATVLAERLCFVDAKRAATSVEIRDSLSGERRGMNRLTIPVDSAARESYAVRIVDATAPLLRENLLSTTWLTGDLRYPVDNAASYFDSSVENRRAALDALLITEKWRWFDWRDLAAGRYPATKWNDDNYLSYSGTVFLGRKLQLNKTINLVFQLQDTTVVSMQAKTDSTGTFVIEGTRFVDTARVYYQMSTRRPAANAIKIFFESNITFQKYTEALPESPDMLVPRSPADSLTGALSRRYQALQNTLRIDRRYKQLQEVIVQSKVKSAREALNRKLSSPAFRSADERTYNLSDPKGTSGAYRSILEWVRLNVPGLSSLPRYRGSIVSIFVDEIPADMSYASMIPVSDVALIKFLPTSTGLVGGDGALVIYTKRGSAENDKYAGLPNAVLAGYASPVPFLAVDHRNDLYKSMETDTRTLYYWSSSVQTDREGRTWIRFSNSDTVGPLRVIVTGFTVDGKPFQTETVLRPL